jgi:hypothetical protein
MSLVVRCFKESKPPIQIRRIEYILNEVQDFISCYVAWWVDIEGVFSEKLRVEFSEQVI